VTLGLAGSNPATLHVLDYTDETPWPNCADGVGHSLVLVSPDSAPDHGDAANWACSSSFGGELGGHGLVFDYRRWVDFTFDAAGAADPAVSGSDRDPDGDGRTNFTEYALGTDPFTIDAAEKRVVVSPVTVGNREFVQVSFPRSRWALPVTYSLQASPDLAGWTALTPAEIDAAPPFVHPDGSISESWRVTESIDSFPSRFLRLLVEEISP
jgi:hypothetical protein